VLRSPCPGPRRRRPRTARVSRRSRCCRSCRRRCAESPWGPSARRSGPPGRTPRGRRGGRCAVPRRGWQACCPRSPGGRVRTRTSATPGAGGQRRWRSRARPACRPRTGRSRPRVAATPRRPEPPACQEVRRWRSPPRCACVPCCAPCVRARAPRRIQPARAAVAPGRVLHHDTPSRKAPGTIRPMRTPDAPREARTRGAR
jgi:hypothetical protein